MERKIVSTHLKWKNNPDRMPLLLPGARQVGKTFTLLTFGKGHYKNVAYFSMEESGDIPAVFECDLNPAKVYMVDTGLLCSKLDIAANVVLNTPPSFDGFKGALTENYIMQALAVNGIFPYFWSSPGKAEVDFVFQDKQGGVIPLEAKSAENVRSKSLRTFRDIYKPATVFRVSARIFGFENGIKHVPLYAVIFVNP